MYIAHKADGGREEPIKDHLSAVAAKSAEFAKAFGSSDWAYNMGFLHDVGKYSDGFQKRIKEDGPKVDHASAGAYAISGSDIGYLLSYCIAGHHSGLPNGDFKGGSRGSATLKRRLNKIEPVVGELLSRVEKEGLDGLIGDPSIPPLFESGCAIDTFSASMWIRMMFSCLVDADYLATEEFMSQERRRDYSDSVTEGLLERLEDKIKGFYPPKSSLDALRCDLLDACKEAAKGDPGFYSLTVPTGGGKTLASLRFALHHLAACGVPGGCVIYALPYTSIIEQNADVFRGVLNQANVLEHHANFDFDSVEDPFWAQGADSCGRNLSESLRLAAENWDIPVVVTTNVQFFESIYANKSSKCRKLHNIANSVIILDEAQMLPIDQLKPCLAALKELVDHFGCTVVFCTATQPALDGVLEIVPDVTEICPFKERFFAEMRRVTYRMLGEISDDDLAETLNDHDRVLCIVNSKKQARNLYDAFDVGSRFHLSTSMYPEHRRKVIAAVRYRLMHELPCRVVSTSLVEAGVDFDFPVVYREMCGLDSIVQAAGRCNRNNKRDAAESPVFVFESSEDYRFPPEIKQRVSIAKAVMRDMGLLENGLGLADRKALSSDGLDLGRLDILEEYFARLMRVRDGGTDKKEVYQMLSSCEHTSYPFATAAENFRLFTGADCSIVIPHRAIQPEIEKLKDGEADRAAMRKLRNYTVSVYPNAIRRLSACLANVAEDVYVLTDPSCYSEETGLITEVPFGEGLMWG